jgi:hypothetical protein
MRIKIKIIVGQDRLSVLIKDYLDLLNNSLLKNVYNRTNFIWVVWLVRLLIKFTLHVRY